MSGEIGLRPAWKMEMTKASRIGGLAAMTAASLAASLLLVLTDLPVTPARAQTSTPEATLVGAGDIASCSHNRDRATARVLADVAGTVFTLGDNVYPNGTTAEFRECYRPTWGTEKARTKPSVGNHEYHTRDASGYFGYFGARAGDPARGYYSYQRGSPLRRKLRLEVPPGVEGGLHRLR